MSKNPYRTLLIWAVLVIALFNIYPTVGWMMLPDDKDYLLLTEEQRKEATPKEGTRQARLVQWQAEDLEHAKERPGYFKGLYYDIKRWVQFDRSRVINLGLDLQGGIHMVLGFDVNDLPQERLQFFRDNNWSEEEIEREVQETVLDQVSRRVNDFEAKEPVIQALGTTQIQIQLPGEKDIHRAKQLITKTALLNFHLVAGQDETVQVFRAIQTAYPDRFAPPFIRRPTEQGGPISVSGENYQHVKDVLDEVAAKGGIIPENRLVAFSEPPKAYEDQRYDLYVLEKDPLASGEGLTSAAAVPDDTNPLYWQILFSLNNSAGAEFGAQTEKNINRPMAIVIDDAVISVATIRDRISTNGVINGTFTAEEARDLSIALNSGSMVVPVREEMTRVVGATLGRDSVRAGVISSIASLAIVGLFMMLYYRGLGIVAVLALMYNGILIIAAMAYFNMTLTLPGIAGLILTIGMAVDANVLIYERLRDELRLGHTVLSSIENAFQRVAVTILDANITTLIAAAVLFQFGTGPIEGFAITLTVGIVTTVFTALVVSREIIDIAVARKWLRKLKMMTILKQQPSIDWMKHGVPASIASAIIIVLGLIVFGVRGADMYGVDFRQGTNINLTLNAPEQVPPTRVREALEGAGFENPVVQESGEAGEGTTTQNNFLIRVTETVEESAAASNASSSDATPPAAPPASVAPVEPAAPAAEVNAPAAPESAGAAPAAPAASAEAEAQEPTAAETPATTAGAAAVPAGRALTTVAERIQNALAPLTAGGVPADVRIENEATVGPAVGWQLRIDALKAIFASLFFIIIYLTIRFEVKFAAGAVVAVIHDVLITVAFFAFLGRQIDMNVIAALLTLIGYSLNDTIVIFDRVREDLRVYRGKGYTFTQILNLAVNATLARTLLTSLTVLFVVIVLCIFGGNAINDFAVALLIGVIAGTYSTIFIASPVVYLWDRYQTRHTPVAPARGESSARRKTRKGGQKSGEATA